MVAAGDGWLETSVAVAVGTYEYKFHLADGEWMLDPGNPRSRCRDGNRNSLLVIGGTDEPLLHAPARPYLHREDDGRVCVRAGLRRGNGRGLVLRWDEGAGWRHTVMARAAEEDEHELFEAHLPGAGKRVDYLFVTDDGRLVGAGGGGGQAFAITVAELGSRAPDWWREAVLYTIFVDRFRRGGEGGRWQQPARTERSFRAGGDLAGIVEALPHLSELGVTALHLTPIVSAPSVHRYDCSDPRQVAPELGGEAGFAALIGRAHAAGLRIIVDLTVTHVDRDFFAFRDVRERGPASPYWDWFTIERYPFSEGYDPGYQHYQKGQWREPLLATANPEVRRFIVDTFLGWVDRGVDGFRIDAASDVPVDLVRDLSRAVKRRNPEVVVFGELIPGNIERWTADAVDAATDFVDQEATYDWLWRQRGATALARAGARRRCYRGGPGWSSIGFVATHDQPRLLTLTGDPAVSRLGLLYVLMRQSVPMLYYGDEVGLSADETADFENSWPDRQCMPWARADWDVDTLALVRAAIALRRAHPALCRGDERFAAAGAGSTIVALRRSSANERIDVLFNAGAASQQVTLEGEAPATLLFAHGQVTVGDRVELGPWSAVVLDRSERVDADIIASNRRLAAMAHAEGALVTPGLPAHLYLTVTEACNLRCQHCITSAPAVTGAGRARTMPDWLIDTLAEGFAAADYFAFAHGGESLVAPNFFALLAAIARARSARPYDVHLLSNGMLLTGATVDKLIDHGVTSLMVSLDGASAATNDAIRCGGKLDLVVDNLRAAVALRASRKADLRIGVSMVVGKKNRAELGAMADLVIDLGVDWLKVEETYPVNSFARRDFVDPADPELTAAMVELRAALASSDVVLVDHLAPDPADAEFRAADDFANRASFVPARAAWEQACIDPDGTVHLVDYSQPAIGNLRQAALAEIWNGERARAQRRRALQATHSRNA